MWNDSIKYWFFNFFWQKLFCQNIYSVGKNFFGSYKFLWNKNSCVVFNNESKNRMKNGICRKIFGVNVENTEILTFLKIIILGVSCRILGQKVIIVSD